MDRMDRKTVSINRASELVGVTRRTIYNWLSSGKLEYVRTAGGAVRIYVDSLWRDPRAIVESDVAAPTDQSQSWRS